MTRCLVVSSLIFILSLLTGCVSVSKSELAQKNIDELYLDGITQLKSNKTRDHQKAFQYLQVASDKGSALADNALGYMYDSGIGVQQNKAKALHYYQQAAETGLGSAYYNLAYFYYENEPQSPLVQEYLQKAIADNIDNAIILEAKIAYEAGQYRKAYRSFKKAIQTNDADSFFYVGMMQLEGKGTQKSSKLAILSLKKAADQWHVEASFVLGTLYLEGVEVERNSLKAIEYIGYASDQGHTKAMVNYAIMLIRGEDSVPRNLSKAHQLLNMAAKNGDKQAIELLVH